VSPLRGVGFSSSSMDCISLGGTTIHEHFFEWLSFVKNEALSHIKCMDPSVWPQECRLSYITTSRTAYTAHILHVLSVPTCMAPMRGATLYLGEGAYGSHQWMTCKFEFFLQKLKEYLNR
jgi:hypothetical protein